MTLDLTRLSRNSLEAVRQNLGVDPDDSSKDNRIVAMSPREYVARYSEWHLGSRGWGINFYNLVREADHAHHD